MSEPIRLHANRDPEPTTEMREFMLVVRRALLLIVKWIEKTYIV